MFPSKTNNVVLVLFLSILLVGCGESSKTEKASIDSRAASIADESGSEAERIAQMENLQRPVPQEVVEALLMVMKDQSQQAFVMTPAEGVLGYETNPNPFGGPEKRPALRWTAVEALERLAEVQALPDLISALNDRHEVVRHFAARALWRLGSAEGIPVLLKGLEGKALENESANHILKEISGQDFSYDTDAGWSNKKVAIEKWRTFFKTAKPKKKMPTKGADADLDRRVRYLVAILGQHQFLYMEQARRNLGQLDELAVAHIEAGLTDELLGRDNQQLRAYAVQALAKNKSEKADAVITGRCAVDSSPPVRSRAALAMGTLKSDHSREVLQSMLNDPDESVVIAAMRALGARGAKAAIPTLKEHFASESESKRGRLIAAFSLVRMGESDPQFGSYLAKTMTDGESYEKAEIADLLTEWKGELFGWDERLPAKDQVDALKKWRDIFSL